MHKGRDTKGRFGPGNPGRPLGSRNKLEESFLDVLYRDFSQHGEQAVIRAREADPTAYVRVIATLMPKHSERTIKHDVANLSDAEIISLVKDVRDNLGTAPSGGGAGEASKDKTQLN